MRTYKITDHPALRQFLQKEWSATLAMPADIEGGIHAASLMYCHTEQPLAFYFVTAKDSLKCSLLKTKESIPCAAVIGTVKGTAFTIQLHGVLALSQPRQDVVDAYYQKRGNRHDDITDPAITFICFTPNWGRFTDYANGYARFVLDVS